MTAQALLRRATGLSVSKSVAERAVGQRMEQTGFADSEAYLQALTPAEMTQLIELVVVPESWLFRDPQAFYATVELVQERWARGAPRASCRFPARAARNRIRWPWRCATAACRNRHSASTPTT